MRSRLQNFLNSSKDYPFLAAVAAGLYPLLHFYNSNYGQLNSWTQFLFCLTIFMVLPAILSITVYNLMGLKDEMRTFRKRVLCMFNLIWFGLLLAFILIGVKLKIMAVLTLILAIVGYLLWRHLKKIIILQLIMALFVFFGFAKTLMNYYDYSEDWMTQPDDIENIVFKTSPNIYMFEMDGYVNSEELKDPPYSFDNSEMLSKLKSWGFENYKDFRSNYYSTLSSNASIFAMKHHYYFNPTSVSSELPHSRDIIVSDNPALRILKSNNYRTNLIIESPYFLLNRASLGFDHVNFQLEEVPLLSRGFDIKKDVASDLFETMKNSSNQPQFYLVQKFLPSHITVKSKGISTAATERIDYLERLTEANDWMNNVLPQIIGLDPNALIVIVADHGGYVGLSDTSESYTRQTDAPLIKSMFSSILSIRWPTEHSNMADQLKSSVNLFRVLFASLSNDDVYLENLQEDVSYIKIDKGADFGVYKYLDLQGKPVFEKVN